VDAERCVCVCVCVCVWKLRGGKVVLRVSASSVHGKGLFAGPWAEGMYEARVGAGARGHAWSLRLWAGPEHHSQHRSCGAGGNRKGAFKQLLKCCWL
jgi:hypothetical protein